MKYFILSAALEGLEDVTEGIGIDLREALFHAEVDERALLSMSEKVDFEAYLKVLEYIAVQADRPDFGILAGIACRRSVFGMISNALEVAPTLEQLIQILQSMIAVFSNGFEFSISGSSCGQLELTIKLRVPPSLGASVYVDSTLTALIRQGIASHPNFKHPTQSFLMRPMPRNVVRYQRIFGQHVQFGHSSNALIFSRDMLEAHLTTADPGTFAWIQELIGREMRETRLDRH